MIKTKIEIPITFYELSGLSILGGIHGSLFLVYHKP